MLNSFKEQKLVIEKNVCIYFNKALQQFKKIKKQNLKFEA